MSRKRSHATIRFTTIKETGKPLLHLCWYRVLDAAGSVVAWFYGSNEDKAEAAMEAFDEARRWREEVRDGS